MNKHLRIGDDASSAEHAAILEAFEWAIDVLGLLKKDRDRLVRTSRQGSQAWRSSAIAAETMMRHVIAIAADVQALIGDEDEIREWVRSRNPGLWTGSPIPEMTTPLRVMHDHADGVRAIRAQLALERGRTGWLS